MVKFDFKEEDLEVSNYGRTDLKGPHKITNPKQKISVFNYQRETIQQLTNYVNICGNLPSVGHPLRRRMLRLQSERSRYYCRSFRDYMSKLGTTSTLIGECNTKRKRSYSNLITKGVNNKVLNSSDSVSKQVKPYSYKNDNVVQLKPKIKEFDEEDVIEYFKNSEFATGTTIQDAVSETHNHLNRRNGYGLYVVLFVLVFVVGLVLFF